MALRNRIVAFAATTVWPAHRIQWTAGCSRHCLPTAPYVNGVRLVVLSSDGAVVDVLDAETRTALLLKVVARHHVNLIRANQLKRRATLPRAPF